MRDDGMCTLVFPPYEVLLHIKFGSFQCYMRDIQFSQIKQMYTEHSLAASILALLNQFKCRGTHVGARSQRLFANVADGTDRQTDKLEAIQ